LAWVNYVVVHLNVKKKKVYRKQKRKDKAVCLSLIKNKIKVIRGGEILNRADSIPSTNENKLGFIHSYNQTPSYLLLTSNVRNASTKAPNTKENQ
jgi:hypothetical protein